MRRKPAPQVQVVNSREDKRQILKEKGDSTLVESFLGGNELAYEELVERYQKRLLSFVGRKIGDRECAEDIVQEVFHRVYLHIDDFDQSKKFSIWIYAIASNQMKNEFRKRRCWQKHLVLYQTILRSREDGDQLLDFEDRALGPEDLLRIKDLRVLIDETVEKMPEHQRQPFVLREYEGKSYEEIAEITKTNLRTLRTQLYRARHSFRTIAANRIANY